MYDDRFGRVVGGISAADRALTASPGVTAAGRRVLSLPDAPDWRSQVAPGVHAPGVGMSVLPLTPDNGTGVFTATTGFIRWTAQPQRPFRGERLVAIVSRSAGVSAVPIINGAITVGTHVEAVQIGQQPLEACAPTAFGVRMMMVQAEPGILVSIPVTLLGPALAGADTITCSLVLFGEEVR